MPLEELKKLVEEFREKVRYMEENNEPDNELVEHNREHLKMLEEVLSSMTEKELCPSAGYDEERHIEVRSKQTIEERTSTFYPCPQCGARDCTYRTVQIRAADEPSSIRCTCRTCGTNYEARS